MLTEQLDWEKTEGMMPAIVQHAVSGEVLMHGYMNKEALEKPPARSPFTHAPSSGCGPRVKPRAMSSM